MRKSNIVLLLATLFLGFACTSKKSKHKTEICISAEDIIDSIKQNETPEEYGYLLQVGDKAPNFTVELTNGKKVSLSDLKGKVVMLQFTASWCPVCRKEMPHIEKDIWQKHKNNTDFFLMGVDRDEPLEKVKKFKEDIQVTYPIALDPNADVFGLFAVKKAGVTRNVIIDKDGRIAFLTRLYKPEEFENLKKVIHYLLCRD
ncbi:TlpA disulfide reductase family protein [Prolixibacteraceae bacterium]|nr:TlpA disulfide reductase family protein [Prolixibacteraceae bacterium]